MAKNLDLEKIKAQSRGLRGRLVASLENDTTGAVHPEDTAITKFHGIYQQDNRESRRQRREARLEPDYRFMIRVRVPGGVASPQQWSALNETAYQLGGGSLRLTTRQAVQFHGVTKEDLPDLMRRLDAVLMDSLAGCGDVNRNVMCHVQPEAGPLHAETSRIAREISTHLTPRTDAWREIWVDGDKVDTKEIEPAPDPLYGRTYLPRKFKIGIALPPINDVDVYSQDIGLIAIERNGGLIGFNVLAGGGLGCSQGDPNTFPRLAESLGFVRTEDVVAVCEAIVTVQRDYGDRENRRHARFKYTVDDRGIEWLAKEVATRSGVTLDHPIPVAFNGNGDRFGWHKAVDERYQRTVFVEGGRLTGETREALARIVRDYSEDVRITPNHNVILSGIRPSDCESVDTRLRDAGLDDESVSVRQRHSMACVAFPTCGLAMAESERYLPTLLASIDEIAVRHGIGDVPMTIRMSGCPNGCSRPYLGEIGFVGRAPGRYNMYLGAAFDGSRLNRIHRENIDEPTILEIIDQLFAAFAQNRAVDEAFGDYLIRSGTISATVHGSETNELRGD
ncbi:NADPH-dependent assimilatory sulfite reductase hemoprotein subunit [Spiribacter sp. 1M153]|uniref:NADPH-dependent assimilatory sulfite reductase hemoprotein subunit n=1 Tax=Spiribacter TaxID=1335745 RepID=UPI00132F5BA8|nr:NADPH-dependent assimilatory sulfite reductase hemoprotein subunit [Spiribacter sp. SSL99]KAF0285766.1 sulfite reductase subunit beta [Spiribacter sp. SSL99]